MKPVQFKQAFVNLKMPDGIPGGDLPVWTNGKHVLSCWGLSLRERLMLLFTGRIWLWVLSGHTQPPVSLQVETVEFHQPLSGPKQEQKALTEEDVRALTRAVVKRQLKQARRAATAAALMLGVFLVGCGTTKLPEAKPATQEADQFRLVRPARDLGNGVSEPALYEKAGDPGSVWIQALDGTSFIRLGR
jgi:hypothetical protein